MVVWDPSVGNIGISNLCGSCNIDMLNLCGSGNIGISSTSGCVSTCGLCGTQVLAILVFPTVS